MAGKPETKKEKLEETGIGIGPPLYKLAFVFLLGILAPHIITLFIFISSVYKEGTVIENIFNLCLSIKSIVPMLSFILFIAGFSLWIGSWFGFVKGDRKYYMKYFGIGLVLSGVIGLVIASEAGVYLFC